MPHFNREIELYKSSKMDLKGNGLSPIKDYFNALHERSWIFVTWFTETIAAIKTEQPRDEKDKG